MLKFILRRLGISIFVLVSLVIITFFLMHAAPGGPFDEDRKTTPEIERNLRRKYHLDEPVLWQCGRYVWDVLRGDLGPSMSYPGWSVEELLATKLPHSVLLGACALALAVLVGMTLGILAALKEHTWLDYATSAVAALGISIPSFVLAPVVLYLFALKWQLIPVSAQGGFLRLVLVPALVLCLPFIARITRLVRSGMLETLRQPFIRTARAKGLADSAVILRHALSGAVLPLVAYLGPAAAGVLTGSLVIETVFSIPGVGRDFVQAALNRDYPMVMGTVLLYSGMLVVFNLMADIVHAWLDPRVRISGR